MDTPCDSTIQADESCEIHNSIMSLLSYIKEWENPDLWVSVCIALSTLPEWKTDKNIIWRLSFEEQKRFNDIVRLLENSQHSQEETVLKILHEISIEAYDQSELAVKNHKEHCERLLLLPLL